MGGLCCGTILAKEGKKVIILEKNRQLGGNLQVFSRDKCVFDTGVHYIGGLDEGQNMNQLFKYFNILKDLKLKRLNEDGFDHIHFFKEKVHYKYGIGYQNFAETLCAHFPNEKAAIDKYCASILDIVKKLPLAQLKADEDDSIAGIDFTLNARQYINSLTSDKRLQKVLGGTNMLYAGSYKTPFYVHALVLNSYIESSWRCVDGASQIAKLLAKQVMKYGGVVRNRSEVVSANYNEGGTIKSVILKNGKEIKGKNFISNMHPKITIDTFGEKHFKKSYVQRIQSLKNTGSMFTLHIAFKENMVPYRNYNIFQINQDDIWDLTHYSDNTWPSYYMATMTPNFKSEKFGSGMSVICGMGMEEVAAWNASFNNVTNQKSRGEDYEIFKNYKAQKVINALEIHFPDIRNKIKSYSASTPLTQRDYTGSPDGSGYGIEKDSEAAFKTIVNTKTNIPNLFLTGQNLTLHGILGVSLSALLTCFNLCDKNTLMKKINAA